MIILIDGYNVLKALLPYNRDITETERNQFINKLAHYGQKKKHTVVVVFDAGPYDWPYKDSYKGIYIVYSGAHKTADDCIKEYIKVHSTHDILLVSRDRELIIWAEQFYIPSIDVLHFYRLLKESNEAKEQKNYSNEIIKTTQTDNVEIDALMHEASNIVPMKSDDLTLNLESRIKKEKLKKKERFLLKKLKKL